MKSVSRFSRSSAWLAKGFPGRRFHDDTVYIVRYEGAHLDNSIIGSLYVDKMRAGNAQSVTVVVTIGN